MKLPDLRSVRAWLAIPLFILVLSAVGSTAYTVYSQKALARSTATLADKAMPFIVTLADISSAMNAAYLAERSSLMMSVKSPDFAKLQETHDEALAQAAGGLARLPELNTGDVAPEKLEQANADLAQWSETTRKVIALRAKDKRMSRLIAIDLSSGDSLSQFETFKSLIREITDHQLAATTSSVKASVADSESVSTQLTAIGGLSALFGLFVAYFLPARFSRRLNDINNRVTDIAQGDGDLTKRIGIAGKDEISRIAGSFDQFSESLHATILQAKLAASAVANSANEISSGNQSLSSQAENQVANILDASGTLSELSASVAKTADSTEEATQSAISARNMANTGNEVLGRTVTAMNEISESSHRILDIIGVVDSIAFQTDVLALNAAVEASRAGEQGRGFAVVANEVRNLSQRSAAAANEIRTLIQSSHEKIELGTRLVNESGETLEKIIESVVGVSASMEEISSSNNHQVAGVQGIDSMIVKIGDSMQGTTAFVEEMTATSLQLAELSSELLDLMSRFKLNEHRAESEALQA